MASNRNALVDASVKNHLLNAQISASALARTVDGTICKSYCFAICFSGHLESRFSCYFNLLILPLHLLKSQEIDLLNIYIGCPKNLMISFFFKIYKAGEKYYFGTKKYTKCSVTREPFILRLWFLCDY